MRARPWRRSDVCRRLSRPAAAGLLAALAFAALPPAVAQDLSDEGAAAQGLTAADPRDDAGAFDDLDGFDDFADFGEDKGVTLTAAPDTTSVRNVITREEIERRQAPDLATLLEESLDIGITARGAYGNESQINIRGFNTERIGILVDGIPANSPRSGEFDVSQIDLSNVERIEVIYGGSDSKYNVTGAMGGIINIITKKKQSKGWSFGGGFTNTGYFTGRYNRRHSGGTVGDPHWEDLADTQFLNLFAAWGSESFSAKVSWFGDWARNHYLYQDYGGFVRRKESNEVLDTGGNVFFTVNLPRDSILVSSSDLYTASRHFPVTGTSVGFAQTYDSKITERLQLEMPRFIRDDISCDLALSWTWADNQYGAISSSNDHYLTAINRWGWYPFEALTLRSGLDWRFIHVDSTDDGIRDGNQGGAYLAAEYKPWKPLMLVFSTKGVTDLSESALVPKAGLVWQIADTEKTGIVLKNNYFRGFKFPDFDDLYYRSFDDLYVGNPGLESEDGLGADLAGEFRFGSRFNASVSVYAQWTERAIHWIKYGSRWRPENVGTSCFIGGDIRPSYTIPFSKGPFTKLTLGLTYQLQFSWLLNDNLDFSDALRIPYMPMHIAGSSLDLQWKTGSFLVSAHWESLRFADTLNRMPLDPYCLLNLTVNQE
ncbi:MAG: TonB-dependent receptor plug domain-containing protein, partial [Treponema sp.]|nr:TonB-dependent receptor plug domain-containing protein [Treponema sp.]